MFYFHLPDHVTVYTVVNGDNFKIHDCDLDSIHIIRPLRVIMHTHTHTRARACARTHTQVITLYIIFKKVTILTLIHRPSNINFRVTEPVYSN